MNIDQACERVAGCWEREGEKIINFKDCEPLEPESQAGESVFKTQMDIQEEAGSSQDGEEATKEKKSEQDN